MKRQAGSRKQLAGVRVSRRGLWYAGRMTYVGGKKERVNAGDAPGDGHRADGLVRALGDRRVVAYREWKRLEAAHRHEEGRSNGPSGLRCS